MNSVDKMEVPLFVVEALRSQGQPVWYMNALNKGHGYRKKENRCWIILGTEGNNPRSLENPGSGGWFDLGRISR